MNTGFMNQQMPRYQLRRQFFSLIELMVVITILGLMASVVTVSVMKNLAKAKYEMAGVEIGSLKNAVRNYYLDMNDYPNSLDDLVQGGNDGRWNGPYIEDGVIPKDPWDNAYQYETPGPGNQPFDIISYGANQTAGGEGFDADISCWPTE